MPDKSKEGIVNSTQFKLCVIHDPINNKDWNLHGFFTKIKDIEDNLTDLKDLPRMLEDAEERFVDGMATKPDQLNVMWSDTFKAIRRCKELIISLKSFEA